MNLAVEKCRDIAHEAGHSGCETTNGVPLVPPIQADRDVQHAVQPLFSSGGRSRRARDRSQNAPPKSSTSSLNEEGPSKEGPSSFSSGGRI